MSARTNTRSSRVSPSARRLSSTANWRAWRSMASEKSNATTHPYSPLLANLRVKRPLPHEASTSTFPLACGRSLARARANSSSGPGNPARLNESRHPRSYANATCGVSKVEVPR